MKEHHVPSRTCLGCRQVRAKKELIRIFRTRMGEVVLDRTGKEGGRGAYLCPSTSCLIKAFRKKGKYLSHALRTSLSAKDLDRIAQDLMCYLKERGINGG